MFNSQSATLASSTAINSRILIYEKDGSSLKPVKIYFDQNGRKWVEARNNTKFVIEIKNDTYENYLAVVSVDGLNVINAKRAELKPESGYILNRFSSMKINGWRTSLEEVREFIFTENKKDSYSSKLGAEESNLGVIGLAFFREIPKSNYWTSATISTSWPPSTWTASDSTRYGSADDIRMRSSTVFDDATTYSATASLNTSNSYATSNSTVLRSFSAGTKQGSAVRDKVQEVQKEFFESPSFTDVIYYDTRENLIANGIIKEEVNKLPEPFASTGFCPVV